MDFTWGAGGSTAALTVDLAVAAKEKGLVPNMHLTCTNMDADLIDTALKECEKHGIDNILALRGDAPAGQEEWNASDARFTCALDLVQYIRKTYGKYFNVSVAGYPEGHPTKILKISHQQVAELSDTEKVRLVYVDGEPHVCNDKDYQAELAYLKQKVDAGASFIVTQLFFDVDCFFSFVKQCRDIGIQCPILPGIMCLSSFPGFSRMIKFCKTRISNNMQKRLEMVKEDTVAFQKFGIEYGIEMCKALLGSKLVPGLHFYTLNQENTVNAILEQL